MFLKLARFALSNHIVHLLLLVVFLSLVLKAVFKSRFCLFCVIFKWLLTVHLFVPVTVLSFVCQVCPVKLVNVYFVVRFMFVYHKKAILEMCSIWESCVIMSWGLKCAKQCWVAFLLMPLNQHSPSVLVLLSLFMAWWSSTSQRRTILKFLSLWYNVLSFFELMRIDWI